MKNNKPNNKAHLQFHAQLVPLRPDPPQVALDQVQLLVQPCNLLRGG